MIIVMSGGTRDYEDREEIKARAWAQFYAGEITPLTLFERLSYPWWLRQDAKVSLYEYRRHLARALHPGDEMAVPEVFNRYPPAKGKWKIAPGCSDYCPKGI
jgi:hypothetical protein